MEPSSPVRIGLATQDESLVARLGVALAPSRAELIVADSPSMLDLEPSPEAPALTISDLKCVRATPWIHGDDELVLHVRHHHSTCAYQSSSYVYRRDCVDSLVEHLAAWVPGLRRGLDAFSAIRGLSPAVELVRQQLRGVSRFHDVSVMLLGETGTGKELAARALHDATFGPEAPYVAINCAALPAELLESELFGHEAGAYTGARGVKTGLFEAAAGGTIFLDEIGEMALALQPKLLRVLESREFRRIGSTQTRRLSARVVSATNQDPWHRQTVALRPDLAYRLAGFTINLPPLRDRNSDIELLTRHFLESFNKRYLRERLQISKGAMRLLQAHDWPGNIRELRAVVEHAAIMATSSMIISADIQTALRARSQSPVPQAIIDVPTAPMQFHPGPVHVHATPIHVHAAAADLPTVERTMICQALEHNQGNISRTARQLGIPRSTLRSKLERMEKEVVG